MAFKYNKFLKASGSKIFKVNNYIILIKESWEKNNLATEFGSIPLLKFVRYRIYTWFGKYRKHRTVLLGRRIEILQKSFYKLA